MEKKSKIKLNQLNKTELSDREMNRLLGGNECCVCGCRGISSTLDNGQANEKYGYIPGDIEMGTIYGTQS